MVGLRRETGKIRPRTGRGTAAFGHRAIDRLTETVGGRARLQAVVLLAAVLALSAADFGAVGAVAFQLESALHVGNTEIGLMVTASSVVGALATIPVGAMTDRRGRVRLLWISAIIWAVAQGASALAPNYLVLLLTRLALGAVTATAGPTVASLTGDFFPPDQRSRIYGFILTGEFVGTGLGVLLAGLASAVAGWRAAFAVLALPSLGLAWALRRKLVEPARGGQSMIETGDFEIVAADVIAAGRRRGRTEAREARRSDVLALRAVEAAGFEPTPAAVVDTDPAEMSIGHAVRYVLSVRTNVILILASSLGYFFFAGLETFALVFMRSRYQLGQGTATVALVAIGLGGIAGLMLAGNRADALLRRGIVDARIRVGVIGFLVAVVLLAPGIASPWLWLSIPLFWLAAAAISAPNPALDAARLDVVPARLWGRAEGIRTVARQALVAFAPLLFGYLSEVLGGGRQTGLGTGVGLGHAHLSQAQATGLELTFLIMLVPLAAAGLVLLYARSSYPPDVAAAGESDRRIRALRSSRS
jgi:predicted MFS family arabinose efflux permease